jgi:hypothetical protein
MNLSPFFLSIEQLPESRSAGFYYVVIKLGVNILWKGFGRTARFWDGFYSRRQLNIIDWVAVSEWFRVININSEQPCDESFGCTDFCISEDVEMCRMIFDDV